MIWLPVPSEIAAVKGANDNQMKMTRRDFLNGSIGTLMSLKAFGNEIARGRASSRQPVMFIGHGSPMNIIRDNAFTKSLRAIGENTERPKALLVISAHWLTRGQTAVTTNPKPKTIHDFNRLQLQNEIDVARSLSIGFRDYSFCNG